MADLGYGVAGTGGVALGALNGDQLRFFIDGGADAVVVEGAVLQQLHLTVADAVFRQGAGRGAGTDHAGQRVVRRAHRREQLVTRQQIGRQCQRQRMSTAGDLGPYQSRLCAEDMSIDALQIVPPVIIVAVAGGGIEMHGSQAVGLHGLDHLGLIVLRHGINVGELGFDLLQNCCTEVQHLLGNTHLGVQFIGGHSVSPCFLLSGNVTPFHFISARMG